MGAFIHAKVEIGETAATIAADGQYVEAAVDAIKSARKDIERMIRRDRFFMTTLEPYTPKEDDGPVISRMCDASARAGIGPMSAVAGTIAQVAMEAMESRGCSHGWVDNGGDVALILEKPATMEIFWEPGSESAVAMELEPSSRIIGVCASSGTLGHSISFGNADAAVAMADSAILADALATALGNRATDEDTLNAVFDPFKGMEGFIGGFVKFRDAIAMHGRFPKIVEVEHNPEKMTVHSRMASPAYLGCCSSHEVRP